MSSSSELWAGRLKALGRSQNRILFWLLVLGSFYLAVDSGQPTVTVPILGLDLLMPTVMAAGPVVLTLLTLALLGALRAAGRAGESLGMGVRVLEQYRIGPGPDDVEVESDYSPSRRSDEWESHDHNPGLFDLILYRHPHSRRSLIWLRHVFDLIGLLVIAEASWLWHRSFDLRFDPDFGFDGALGAVAAVLIPVAVMRWLLSIGQRLGGSIELFRSSRKPIPLLSAWLAELRWFFGRPPRA